jgi:transcriptional regulator with XRE-family HTH domain
VHTWRTSEEISLKDLGKLIGMSVANLCDIEKGRKGVSPEKAEQIAKAIGVPPALLVRLSIEESLRAAGLHYKVEIKPAA